MAGIIGIQGYNKSIIGHQMLNEILHRCKSNNVILLKKGLTIGIASNDIKSMCRIVEGGNTFSFSQRVDSTSVALQNEKISLKRDKYGVDPLYYVILDDNTIAFASEVKALLFYKKRIFELLPGYILEDLKLKKYYELEKEEPLNMDARELSIYLKEILVSSIKQRLSDNKVGAWLSGGLDSSAISSLLRPLVPELHTFSAGFNEAPDLKYAKIVADHIGSIHHERIVSFEDILKVLPNVIYHLESFDGLLVRSSLMNYLVAQLASEYVDEVFSGEGGDELFAGYEYIKDLPEAIIADELIEITKRLHNTALQRVDRCASAFGTIAHVPFMDEEVVDLALRIPVEFKLHDGIEKWILRLAMVDELPTDVLMRTKSKFWEGSGMGEHFYSYAEGLISDTDFNREKIIKCGWVLNSKEELMYYRIFKEHFGELDDLSWMGRSKLVTAYDKFDKN